MTWFLWIKLRNILHNLHLIHVDYSILYIKNLHVLQAYRHELLEAYECCMKYRRTGKDAELTQVFVWRNSDIHLTYFARLHVSRDVSVLDKKNNNNKLISKKKKLRNIWGQKSSILSVRISDKANFFIFSPSHHDNCSLLILVILKNSRQYLHISFIAFCSLEIRKFSRLQCVNILHPHFRLLKSLTILAIFDSLHVGL